LLIFIGIRELKFRHVIINSVVVNFIAHGYFIVSFILLKKHLFNFQLSNTDIPEFNYKTQNNIKVAALL
jgi:hypothetical protein